MIALLEFEEVNVEINLEYDLKYPPLTKRIKDHPRTQALGDIFSRVFTRAQLKEKHAL